ncbi:hypothetical protein FRACA_170037 [Frankia canadensis]|uniref:Uncharacterized protein n=1 Tax=Frankia canadensis TaxID=1836972 RepID=A0A2I2KN24_9ACTN|nr:hypothetical protein [Frankia canadensis]SNQ47077.1 hypothetical protein FRACA_170037 [Frankia canadensis]SOU54367.1 hypothetical protein FRACA_170037 [Frankia canadensis]
MASIRDEAITAAMEITNPQDKAHQLTTIIRHMLPATSATLVEAAADAARQIVDPARRSAALEALHKATGGQ